MRAAAAERNSETLRAADGDVRAELPRRTQQRERERVGSADAERTGGVRLFKERCEVVDAAACIGILHEHGADGFLEIKAVFVANDHSHDRLDLLKMLRVQEN